MTLLVQICLSKLQEDGHQTIAFPPLGVGDFKYPARISAVTMLTAIKEFSTANQDGKVTTVHVVVDITDPDFTNIWKV